MADLLVAGLPPPSAPERRRSVSPAPVSGPAPPPALPLNSALKRSKPSSRATGRCHTLLRAAIRESKFLSPSIRYFELSFIILDVPSVGGRLMLVDMAGSENIEAAGQTGFEAKMQDSFVDDKSKILMILCASPGPHEMLKTISTLEYGAKAKCIVRAAHPATPKPSSQTNSESINLLASQIALMNQHICELQRDKWVLLKERDQALKSLSLKDDELASAKFTVKRMEEKVVRQENEIELLKNRLTEFEFRGQEVMNFGYVATRLADVAGDQSMVKSMELDYGDQ